MKKKNIGSTLDNWLREEGLYEEVSAAAIKRVVARQVERVAQPCSSRAAAFPSNSRSRRRAIGRDQ